MSSCAATIVRPSSAPTLITASFSKNCTSHATNTAPEIHAYVLMTNHLHLLVTPTQEHSLSKTMQMLGRYYVQYYNYTYRRSGTLWEGRYKATR